MLTMTGTEGFKAPEMYKQYTYYNEKVDMWGAGCVLYTMLSGYMPFLEDKYYFYSLIQQFNQIVRIDLFRKIRFRVRTLAIGE